MCGRYTIKDRDSLAGQISHLTGEPDKIARARYNVSPGQSSTVIIRTPRPDKILPVDMKWGPLFRLAGPKPQLMVNARSETVAAKSPPNFRWQLVSLRAQEMIPFLTYSP